MLKHKISLFIITKILHYDNLIQHIYKPFFLRYSDYYYLIIIMIIHQSQTVPTRKND